MRTENGKRNWIRAYLYVKFAELAGIGIVWIGGGILEFSGVDMEVFALPMKGLLWAAFLWELVFSLCRVTFLYAGVRFRIPMSVLAILEIPGWIAFFKLLLGWEAVWIARMEQYLWLLIGVTPLLVIGSFCFDINILCSINEKREEMTRAGKA